MHMTLLTKYLLILIINLCWFGLFNTDNALGQSKAIADSILYNQNIMENAEQVEDFEKARRWLNRYYHENVTTDEADVPIYKLVDPLITTDGIIIDNINTWVSARRPEIIGLFEENVYGKVPDFDYELEFQTRSIDSKALGGMATRKQISILFGDNHLGLSIELLIYLPNHVKDAAPAMVGLSFYGNQTVHQDEGILLSEKWMRPNESIGIRDNRATNDTRGAYSERWQVEKVLERGYGIVTAYAGDIEPDDHHRMEQGVRALAYGSQARPAPDEWGTLSAWAWGLSRMMDYIETDDDIDHQRIGLIGHSRLGKAALWAGALDERFSLVISNNSGSGGAALSNRKYGETVGVINTSFPHWFCDNYNQFNDREENLPVDQHMLLSLIAPRPLYVASATNDQWADPKGEFLSAREASPVWELYDLEGLPVTSMPEIDRPVMGTIGYHLRTGGHGLTRYDWDNYLNFADMHFSK